MNLFEDNNAAAFATADITGVEVVRAQTSNAGATALDVSGNAGVTKAGLFDGTTGANTVTLTKTQTGSLQGDVGTTATFAFTSVGGSADAATLALDAAEATVGVTVAGIETLTLSATGANDLGALTAAATSELVITGAGDVALTFASAALETVSASAATGDLTLDLSTASAANDVTVTTGSGDDNVTVSYADLSVTSTVANDTFALGTGTDTLTFDDSISFLIAADATLLGKTTGAATLTDMASADSVEFGDVVVAASTIAMKLGQNTANLALVGTDANVSDATAGITLTGASTVNVRSTGSVDLAGPNVLALSSDDNGTVNLTGDYDTTLTLVNNGGTTGFSVAAGAFTGALGVTGTADTDAIVSGSGDDTITATTGGDTYTGGAGDDAFVFAGATEDATVTDFVAGADTLDLTGFGAASFTAAKLDVSGAVTLAAALDIAAAGAGGVGTEIVSWFQFEGNTYVVADGGAGATFAGGTDLQVTLTGLVTLTATEVLI